MERSREGDYDNLIEVAEMWLQNTLLLPSIYMTFGML